MSRHFEENLLNTYGPDPSGCRNHNTHLNHIVIAVLIKRGRVIANSTNKIGTRSKGSGYSDYTIHAEKAVVKKLGDISKLRGATMYIWRISRLQIGLLSKPCHDCSIFLEKCKKQYGLKAVFYTNNPVLIEL